METYQTFAEFWPYYVREHSLPINRWLHFAGSTLALILLVGACIAGEWIWLVGLPIVGYGLAWIGHFFLERNRPATFQYPLWSLAADWKMWFFMLVGAMDREVERCRAAPAAPVTRRA